MTWPAAMAALLAASPADPSVQAFLDDCRRAVPGIDRANRVLTGSDGWLFFAPELLHLGAGPFWGADAARASLADPAIADPLPAILDFRDQLAAAGVDLIVVPVPPRILVFPEKLWPRYGPGDGGIARRDPHHQAFYALLRDKGVRVLDPWPDLAAARDDPHGPSFCRQDHHWSGVGVVAVARRIALAIAASPWHAAWRSVHAVPLESAWESVTVRGDLATMKGGDLPAETLAVRRVGRRAEGRLSPVPDDPGSPVLLLGDSNVLVFHSGRTSSLADNMHTTGAGLADQLAFELGYGVDVIGSFGSGNDAARVNFRQRSASRPGYLAGKKTVVWCFNTVAFTWIDGWRKLPLAGTRKGPAESSPAGVRRKGP